MSYIVQLLLLAPASLWAGYVVSVVWSWYLEPIGLPHLGAVRAVGIFVLVRLLTPVNLPTHKPQGKEFTGGELLAMSVAVWALGPALALFFGWAWRHLL